MDVCQLLDQFDRDILQRGAKVGRSPNRSATRTRYLRSRLRCHRRSGSVSGVVVAHVSWFRGADQPQYEKDSTNHNVNHFFALRSLARYG